jgi:putative transposase
VQKSTDVVSRNKFLTVKYVRCVEPEEYMRVLNKRKLRWILREVKKGDLSVYKIAKQQGVTSRWVRKLARRYGDTPLYKIETGIPGRMPEPIAEKERTEVLKIHEKMPMCAVKIEQYLKANELSHIPHNRIHRILLAENKVSVVNKRIRRKKWVRYERRHSNSLWHTDFCEYDRKHIISYIDDASRYIVGYGAFNSATTDNALSVFASSIERYGAPKQVMTDHGAQFCANEERIYRFSETLKDKGVEHILARVKRPQSNGKIERWFGTIKRLYTHFNGDLERAVACYNRMPHLSLGTTPEEAFRAKMRNY